MGRSQLPWQCPGSPSARLEPGPLLCGGTVRVHTSGREVITFGYRYASPGRRLDRGRLVRASIRLARRSHADRRPPVLRTLHRPWWAYGILVVVVLFAWLSIGPGM